MTVPEPPDEISVVVADRYPLLVRGMANCIAAAAGITLAGAAVEGARAIELILQRRPAVAVLGLTLPGRDGLEIIRALRAQSARSAVLLIGEQLSGETVLQCMTAGANGLLSRDSTEPQLIDAIRQAARGHTVLPEESSAAMAAVLRGRGPDMPLAPAQLSGRELEVLQGIASGDSAAVIAASLRLSLPTVKSHIQTLYAKLGVHDRGSAVATAIRRGLIA